MSKARGISNLVDTNGDVVAGALDNVESFTKSASDPTKTTNGTLGDVFVNTTSGEVYVLTDATTDENVWTNVGEGSGNILPVPGLTADDPATSAKAIYDADNTSTDGLYYLNNVWTGNTTRQVYCRFDVQKGGSGSYHVQKFLPSHLSGYSASSVGPSTGTFSVPNSTLDDATTYNTQYTTSGSSSGAAAAVNTTVTVADIGQIFLMIEHKKTGSGDGSNPTGEAGPEFSTDGSGQPDSAAAVSGNTYSTTWQGLPNQDNYLTAGYLLPSNAGSSAFTMSQISASYGTDSTSQANATASFESAGTSLSPSGSSGTYSVDTDEYFAIGIQGWADSGTATKTHIFWVAAEV